MIGIDLLILSIDFFEHVYVIPSNNSWNNEVVISVLIFSSFKNSFTAVSADDNPDTITVRGLLYYYTTDEYDEIFDDLCNALAEIGAAWAIQNIGYDDNTRQIIYEVAWEVPCGAGAIYK